MRLGKRRIEIRSHNTKVNLCRCCTFNEGTYLKPFFLTCIYFWIIEASRTRRANSDFGLRSQDLSAFGAAGRSLEVSFGGYNDPFATWVQQGLEGVGLDGLQSGCLIGSAYFDGQWSRSKPPVHHGNLGSFTQLTTPPSKYTTRYSSNGRMRWLSLTPR